MDIKKTIIAEKIKQWEIAEIIGISEFTLSRWLRRPENLHSEQKTKIVNAIDQLLKGR